MIKFSSSSWLPHSFTQQHGVCWPACRDAFSNSPKARQAQGIGSSCWKGLLTLFAIQCNHVLREFDDCDGLASDCKKCSLPMLIVSYQFLSILIIFYHWFAFPAICSAQRVTQRIATNEFTCRYIYSAKRCLTVTFIEKYQPAMYVISMATKRLPSVPLIILN